jgi:D-mannonate dehydratase
LRDKHASKFEKFYQQNEAEIFEIHNSYAEQIEVMQEMISQMSQNCIETQEKCQTKLKDLLDVVCEKEAEIQELQEQLEEIMKLNSERDNFSFYKTKINALETN